MYPAHPSHNCAWCLTKLARINDCDGCCCHRVSWWYAFKTVHHSSIQITAYRTDYCPGHQRQAILIREPWESDHGATNCQWLRYTTGTSWCDRCCCVGQILRKDSELPSVNSTWRCTRQLQLTSYSTNWGYPWGRELNHPCRQSNCYIMHLSMYCPTYHPTGKRWGFDHIWWINMPRIRGIWSIFTDNRGNIQSYDGGIWS